MSTQQQPQLQPQPPQQSQPQQPPQPQQPQLWLLQRPQQPHQSYTVPCNHTRIIPTNTLLRIRHEYDTRVVQNMPPVDVPAEDRQEFSQVLEPLFHQCNFADKNLAMIANVLQHENPVRQFIAIVCTVKSQASTVFTVAHPPKYIVTLETLKKMTADMQRIIRFVEQPIGVFSNPKLQNQVPATPRQQEQQPLQQQQIQDIWQQLYQQHQQFHHFKQLQVQQHLRIQQQIQQQKQAQAQPAETSP